jgi:hypothetical protein
LTIFTLFYPLHSPPPPTSTHLLSGLVCSSLFKCIFIIEKSFVMVFHQWIHCTLISLTSSITLPYSFSPTPIIHYSTAFNVFPYAFYLNKCNIFQHYSLSFSFPLPPSPTVPNSPTIENLSCLQLCICLSFRLIFYTWLKACDFCLSEPGLLCLMW